MANYRQLAGMSGKRDRMKVGSQKSGASAKSKKSTDPRESELLEIDTQVARLDEKIDNNPADVAEVYEKVERQYRTVYETEADIKENITQEEAEKLKELQRQDMEDMDRRLKQLHIQQELLDQRERLMQRRWEIDLILMRQKVQQKEQEIQGHEEIIKLRQREAELDQM